jgi:hypothetical protein
MVAVTEQGAGGEDSGAPTVTMLLPTVEGTPFG